LGPFICNSREAGKEVDLILQRLKLKKSLIWRYDPLDFICKRRKKNNMAPYIHHRIPEIEKYANQLQWVENTLEDRGNTEVAVEKTLLDLENQLDENSFLQVQPQEGTMSTPPIMQTPLNEEKNPNRGREEGSSSRTQAFNVQYERGQSKRPRLNPVLE